MRTKVCSQCGRELPLSEYHPSSNPHHKDGVRCYCKDCSKDRNLQRRLKDPERHRERAADWGHRNPGKVKARTAQWRKDHPHLHNLNNSIRRARKLQAMPSWANLFFIEEAYSLAQLRSRTFGFPWHVDHVIPLTHPLVCGLHVENNLAVIPGSENCRKRNKFNPDNPGVRSLI